MSSIKKDKQLAVVRRALVSHILNVLWTDHPYGHRFRRRIVSNIDPAFHEKAKNEMVEDAQAWGSQPKHHMGKKKKRIPGTRVEHTVYSGYIFVQSKDRSGLYMEVELDEKNRVVRILVEID